MNDSTLDYAEVLTSLIQKQMVVIGPDMTFNLIKKVGSIHVDQNGKVMLIDSSEPKTLLINLLNEFLELSELIAKYSVEILLDNYPELPIDPKHYGVVKKVELPPALSEAKIPTTDSKEEVKMVPQQKEDKPPQSEKVIDIITPKSPSSTPAQVAPPVSKSESTPYSLGPSSATGGEKKQLSASELSPLGADDKQDEQAKKITDMFAQ